MREGKTEDWAGRLRGSALRLERIPNGCLTVVYQIAGEMLIGLCQRLSGSRQEPAARLIAMARVWER